MFLHWTDLIIVPLASWLLILAAIYYTYTSIQRNKSNKGYISTKLRQASHRYWYPHHLTSIVIALVICMSILELVRLGISEQYYGALFFTPIGFAVAMGMHYAFVKHPGYDTGLYTRHSNGKVVRTGAGKWKPGMYQRNPLLAFWIAQLVFQSIHIAAVATAPGSPPMYKKSDEVLDMAVLDGLLVVLILLEFFPGQGVVTVRREVGLAASAKGEEV